MEEKGQSSIEYVLVAVFALSILFIGTPGPVLQLMEALIKFASDFSWAASIATLPV